MAGHGTIRVLFLSDTAGVLARREAGHAAEGSDEVGVVTKTGRFSRLLHTVAAPQQRAGVLDAAMDDILHHGKAGGGFEAVAQGRFAKKNSVGQAVQCQRLGQVSADVGDHGLHGTVG